MAMLMPMRRNRNLLSELMSDPFDAFFDAATAPVQAMQKMSPSLMRTDIKETDAGFELTIDLPGFKKDDVQAELKDGYLTIAAQTQSESEDKDEKGTYVRKERFSGKCSRTFYVGDDIEEDDIRAKFEDGVLKIAVPKKQEQPKLEEKKTIAIEG
ncbi:MULTISPECIES: Hsp20/alpha crystallin family protein [Eggerthellaceae]|jgi:heat shock protein Hsp20|uniref:Hsp20/alpha crystallin family protein n=1 Tax=Rubneribacter badeniensis TaxID=2070688 RepID=A0A2K2U6T7_9ACTN|nr:MULTISPECIES: Hsp20/alpha crystallin family protein [Eggerthellaceae]OUO90148.1 heat-shock protein Hsp20 [Gordonibacter sp. An230]OUO96537.1 heat-shock protein Hsp20 [Gordonibacter sp. An232A]PNV65979.1 Hsp20/alpha crystallin family protein [Rubneribacter badeniensis]HJH43850.1 Hsp20/alpha crystallin family protein [Rubneribacter badeniensis]